METFTEILKYTIPAIVVLATAYLLFGQFIEYQYTLQKGVLKNEALRITLPLKLQALERLTLLCERAGIQNTLLRVRNPEMTVGGLRGALLLGISQEFEHNASQQLYVSDTLWKIISQAKNDTLPIVSQIGDDLDPRADAGLLVEKLMAFLDDQKHSTALTKAAIAVRTEAGQYF